MDSNKYSELFFHFPQEGSRVEHGRLEAMKGEQSNEIKVTAVTLLVVVVVVVVVRVGNRSEWTNTIVLRTLHSHLNISDYMKFDIFYLCVMTLL